MHIDIIALTDWEIWQHAQRLSPLTISERLRVIRQFRSDTDIQPIHAEAIDIVRWLADHRDEWSDSTNATYTSYLSAWFKWLTIVDRRLDNPMVKVGTAKVPEREPHPIAERDVPKLLNARMWASTRVMILLALLAGLRVHEIAQVRGEDFDIAGNRLWVTGKGRKKKSIPLHPVLAEVAQNMPAAGWWFPMRGHPTEHIHPKSVSDIIGRTMRRADVRGVPHSLRHWFGSTLLDDGVDIRVVQELMRHRSIASTQIYTHVSDRSQRQAIAGLDLFRATRLADVVHLDRSA